MDDDRRSAQMDSAQLQHVDGTFELTFGSMFLLAAILFLGIFEASSLNSFFGKNILPFLTIVIFLGGGGAVDSLAKKVKKTIALTKRVVFPVRKNDRLGKLAHGTIWVGIPLLTLLLMGILTFNRHNFRLLANGSDTSLIPVFWGLLFGVLWFLVGRKIKMNRSNLMAAVSLAIGAALFINGADGIIAMIILFGALGIALCISGGVTLWQYLRYAGASGELI